MTDDKEQKQTLTLEQKIAEEEKKNRQLKARKQAAEAREKTKQKEQQRKDDTRYKILLGSYVKLKMDWDPDFSEEILNELNDYFSEDRDRKLFGFPDVDA
mgnify:CR=1 FL=1